MKPQWRPLDAAFGRVVRSLRLAAQLSQEELAFRSGLHRTYISFVERGLKSPSLGAIVAIAHALGKSAAEVIQQVENTAGTDSPAV